MRCEGNDEELKNLASQQALESACGHCFIIFMKKAYPINVLNRIKQIPEGCSIYAATADPLQVIIAETDQGRGILGVADGVKSREIESEGDIRGRKELLRIIGYRL